MTYRVREYTRDIKDMNGNVSFKNYYVYCSPEFNDYYQAVRYAVQYSKRTGNSCWVDCLDTYEYFDNEAGKEFGFV